MYLSRVSHQISFSFFLFSNLFLCSSSAMASDKYNTYVPKASDYISRAAVLGTLLYIDGGQVKYNSGSTQQWELLNQTLAIDLSKDWTNSSLEYLTIDRGALPLLNNPVLTPSAQGDALYSFGGIVSFWVAWPNETQPGRPELWKLTPDNSGGGQWTQESVDPSFPYVQPGKTVNTADGGLGYMLGGELDFTSYPPLDYGKVVPISGMIQFNSSTGIWTNITTKEFASHNTNTAIEGGSHFVPSYGPEGIVVIFGTIDPIIDVAANASTSETQPFSAITVYEPQSRSWYQQTASGPSIPDWRADFCIAGVPGDNGTYEIYIHGGTHWAQWGALNTSVVGPLVDDETQLDTIYVLSLPSFTWHQVPYTPLSSRSGHTCHITGTGSSQLLVVGGINFAHDLIGPQYSYQDVWSQGIGVFDLNALSWSSSWKAIADPYKTPQTIKDYIKSNGPTPTSWDSSNLAAVFATSRSIPPSGTADASRAAKSSPSSGSSTSAGAIAGGVVGGVAGLAILGVLLWYFLFRRRPRRQQHDEQHYQHYQNYNTEKPQQDQDQEYDQNHHHYQSSPSGYLPVDKKANLHDNLDYTHELPNGQHREPSELGVEAPPVWELDAVQDVGELPGDERRRT